MEWNKLILQLVALPSVSAEKLSFITQTYLPILTISTRIEQR